LDDINSETGVELWKTRRPGWVRPIRPQNPEDVARVYDAWAESYDQDMSLAGYRHPAISLAILARHVPKDRDPPARCRARAPD
jgi:hypothetical protein